MVMGAVVGRRRAARRRVGAGWRAAGRGRAALANQTDHSLWTSCDAVTLSFSFVVDIVTTQRMHRDAHWPTVVSDRYSKRACSSALARLTFAGAMLRRQKVHSAAR